MTDMTLRVRVPAAVDRVHHALTDAGELRGWLAEHAEVALPDTYSFWGKTTPGGEHPAQRPLHANATSLRFEWTLEGVASTVDFTLEAETPDSTILTLTQSDMPTWDEMMAEKGPRSALQSFWALAVANLVDHIDGRDLTPMCDFTDPEMRAVFTIDAEPARVFHALIDAPTFTRWFGANVEVEPYVGGRFAMGSLDTEENPAKIVDLAEDRRLSMEWPGTAVATWELEGTEGKTRITFTQTGFDPTYPPYGSWMGWLSGFAELRRFLELADWRAMCLSFDLPGMPEGILAIGD
ncbi:MAG TPA: SRPBCC family protein [Actinokineospora sp.]|nr:SRPBCC family protein [Actinokineospora sp.]